MRRTKNIEIIRPVQSTENKKYSGSFIAIGHIDTYVNEKRDNLDNARKLLLLAQENYVDTVILPYMQPYGPIMDYNISKTTLRKKYGLTLTSGYISGLSIIAKNYGVNILLIGGIEKTGSKLYITAFYIPGTIGEQIEKYRKMIINIKERTLGFAKGKEPKIFQCRDMRYSIVLGEELQYPELARIKLYMGADTLFVAVAPNDPVKNYLTLIKLLAYIIHTKIVLVGGMYYLEDKLVYFVPTVIVDEKGDIVFRYASTTQALILFPTSYFIRDNKEIDQDIIHIYELANKLILKKRKRKIGTRKSSPHKA